MAQLSDVGQSFVKAAMKAPFLEREEEHGLAVRWKVHKDQHALHLLAEAHMRLVISMAMKFRRYGLSMADMVQEGHVGLLEAAARFDPEREVRFSTYATWWIRASIQDYILRNWSIVRGGTSSAQKSLFFNLRRIRAKLAQTSGDIGSQTMFKQIADAIGVSTADVEWMNMRLSAGDMSLNAPLQEGDGDNASDRMDFLVDTRPLADEIVGDDIDGGRESERLRVAMQALNPREYGIIRDRRLLEEAETLESLGAKLGISKERVRQIESRAMEKLKAALIAGGRQIATGSERLHQRA